MTKPDLGLPSAIKDSTHQHNREKEIKQLRAENELIRQDNKQLVREVLKLLKGC